MQHIGAPYHRNKGLYDKQHAHRDEHHQQAVSASIPQGPVDKRLNAHTKKNADCESPKNGHPQIDSKEGKKLVDDVRRQGVNAAMSKVKHAAYAKGK